MENIKNAKYIVQQQIPNCRFTNQNIQSDFMMVKLTVGKSKWKVGIGFLKWLTIRTGHMFRNVFIHSFFFGF